MRLPGAHVLTLAQTRFDVRVGMAVWYVVPSTHALTLLHAYASVEDEYVSPVVHDPQTRFDVTVALLAMYCPF